MTEPGDPLRKLRLFLAVGLDDETQHIIGTHLREHLPHGIPGRPAPPGNWHLTLRFLGWTRPEQRDQIMRLAAEAVATDPFRVRFGGLGAFPRLRRATVIWLGVDHGHDQLAELAAVCEEAARDTGFDPEERPYHAHLTLSRARPPVDVTDLVERVPPCPVTMRVQRVQLYESHLRRGGAEYEVIDSIEL